MAPDAATLVREETPVALSPSPPPPPPAPVASRASALSRNWALVLGLGWPAGVAISTVLEPAPANPDAPVSAIAAVVGLIFTAGLLMAVATAAARKANAPVWSSLMGLFALGLVVSCPVSGHHGFGAWWIAELAVYGGMTAASLAALRHR
ncbi:MAG: hypothetical protein ACRD12_10720 [Acidimicrobiales bacterium]